VVDVVPDGLVHHVPLLPIVQDIYFGAKPSKWPVMGFGDVYAGSGCSGFGL
jgi:hypothetical protein